MPYLRLKDCRVAALLAMTEPIGFAGKADVNSNRKQLNTTKNICFPNKTLRFRVIARPQGGRGNLKV